MSSWKNNAKNHVSTNSLIQIVYIISFTKFIVYIRFFKTYVVDLWNVGGYTTG